MSKTTRLSQSEIKAQLAQLRGWTMVDEKLTREFKLGTFQKAFSFMSQIAAVAEELQHHPEWFNAYDVVRIQLSTHDVGGISRLDFDLAKRINGILEKTG